MTSTETLNDGLKRAYDLVIAADVIAGKIDAAIREVAPQVRMPGFRPGKVPGNLIRKMHGPALRRDAVQEAVNEAVNELMNDYGYRPAMQPDVNLDGGTDDGEDVKVSVAFEILPDVPEAKIEGIALERLKVEADEAEVAKALADLAEGQKLFEPAKATHKAAKGDSVVIDYKGTVDGKPFDGGSGEGMDVEIGSGRLIPGFEDGLLGAKKGEERTIDVTFPDDYPAKNLAGRKAQFAIKVNEVKQPKKAEVGDELATNLGLENLEKLKEVVKDQVEADLAGLTRTYLKRKLLDHFAANYHFDVPPSMVEAEFKQIWQQVESSASEEEKAEMEADREDYGRIAERRVRLGLLLSDIGQKNDVQVTQAEMNRLVAQEAARFPGQERDVAKYFAENPMAAAQLRAPLFEEKVVDFLIGKADISDKAATRAELEAAIESDDETPIGDGHSHAGHDHAGHDHAHDHAGHSHAGHDHDHSHDHGGAKKAAKKPARKASAQDAAPEEVKPAKEKPAGKAAPKAEKASTPAKKAAASDGVTEKAEKAPAKKRAAPKKAEKEAPKAAKAAGKTTKKAAPKKA